MRKHVPLHANSQNSKVFSAESRPARYFMQPVPCLRSSAEASARSPFFPIPASVIFPRSCFLEMRSGGLCASLTADTLDELFSQDILGADYVEVRLDYLKDPQ